MRGGAATLASDIQITATCAATLELADRKAGLWRLDGRELELDADGDGQRQVEHRKRGG